MDLKGNLLLAALVVMCTADWHKPSYSCPQPENFVNATIADISGTLQFVKYYTGKEDSRIDGLAYIINKRKGRTYFEVNMTLITKDKRNILRTYVSADRPFQSSNKLYHSGYNGKQVGYMLYSIPFIEKNSSAVYYRCFPGATEGHHRTIQVLTTKLDNNLTKALKVVRNIILPHEKLIELPFNHKHLFLN